MQTTDEAGIVNKYIMDADGKLVGRTKINGETLATTRYARDGLGRITGVTDPLGNGWKYTFDLGGRRKKVEDPDLGTWIYGYDTASRLTAQTDARGVVTTLTYDDLNRVKVKTVNGAAAGLATETTTNTYDDNTANGHAGYFNTGKLTDATRQIGQPTISGIVFEPVNVTQRFDYDLAGRLKRERHVNVAGAERTLAICLLPDGRTAFEADGQRGVDGALWLRSRWQALWGGQQPVHRRQRRQRTLELHCRDAL